MSGSVPRVVPDEPAGVIFGRPPNLDAQFRPEFTKKGSQSRNEACKLLLTTPAA
jgi:hypothetical protein